MTADAAAATTADERPAGRSDLPLRRTARILLADDGDRILLFRFVDPKSEVPGGVFWGTPGGGVDEGESLPQAAARELFEETGLRVPQDSFERVVARAEGAARYAGQDLWYEDHFYFLRAAAFELDESGWEEVERETMAEYRWWTVAELAAAAEPVYPPALARIMPDLLAGRLPAEPFDADEARPGNSPIGA